MRLEGHFEEQFGRDILSEPARKIALKMSRSVVALASFSRDCKGITLLHRYFPLIFCYMVAD
jgi:hypothetical protein